MQEEYNAEVNKASVEKEALMKSGALVNEETVKLLTDAADLQKVKKSLKLIVLPVTLQTEGE